MPLKQALLVILVGSSVFISMNALSTIFYLKPSWFLVGKIISGPVIALLFFSKKHREYRAKIIIFILTLAGASGSLHIAADVAGVYLYGNNLPYPTNIYFYQGLMNIIYLVVSFFWYRKSKEKN